MSILIKGMEMPKSCSKCGWFDMGGGDGYRCTLLRKSFDMWNKISVARDKNCPLIELPPHGRLIDADAVNKAMDERIKKLKDDKSIYEASCVSTALDMFAPTVIEAEGSEE